jgi:aminoglycoside 6'-N-acetyltransferase
MGQRNRAHLARYEADNPARALGSEQEAEALVQELGAAFDAGDAFFLGAFHRETGQFVAQVYVGAVDWQVPAFTIGFFADQAHQGQGYVTEAVRAVLGVLFQEMGAHRVRMECDDTNARSQRVAERCGLVREGHLREDKIHPDGTRSGTLLYGLLRREFVAGASGGTGPAPRSAG